MSTLTEAADAAHAAHLRAAVEENAALRSEVAHAETMRQGDPWVWVITFNRIEAVRG